MKALTAREIERWRADHSDAGFYHILCFTEVFALENNQSAAVTLAGNFV